ncbi:hypothetical protein L1049_003022 [Liquidambar formosana]|uniref:Cysteine-rich receptor-like protein kinase 43 n=1 Tax=Liquidambar formosana TaxID=63359 RepID=A0AAP0NIA9_LIQFO
MASSLLSFIFLIPSLIHEANAAPRTDIIARSCTDTQVRNMTEYMESYQEILVSMTDEMPRNKFAFKEAGEAPDRMFLLAECMDDLSGEECDICFTQINTLLSGCFPSTGGRIYLDGCFIRAENYNFFRETISTDDDMKRCGNTIDSRHQFGDTAMEVISKLIQQAPGNRGYAEYHNKSDDVSVYGMATCWKTLDHDLCAVCLNNASKSAISCLPSTEGRVLNSGCFLRYSDYEFANDPKKHKDKDDIYRYVSYVLASVAICTLAIAIGFFVGILAYTRHNHPNNSLGMNMESSVYMRSMQFLQFKYLTLQKATEQFNEAHKLGQGGFGEVFKGTLPDGREIAIKRLYISGKCGSEEVLNELDIISRAQHRNLVRFLGCCFTNIDSFLVYEYLPHRSLDYILFDPEKKKELDWKKRLAIIIGTAEGLEYLHKDCQVRIVHRDIKASNILLDIRYKPKIADFGLARFYSCNKTPVSTAIAGTLGYMAPEYLAQGRLTEKVDVYSYGVLVLEIVSGEQNNKFSSKESLDTLVTAAWKHFQSNTVSEIIDESMDIADLEEIKRVVQVGLLCTQEFPCGRPSMTMIVQMLRQKDVELPTPNKPPFTDESMEVSYPLGCSQHPSNISDLCISPNSDDIEPAR